jgi:hypothetical protein
VWDRALGLLVQAAVTVGVLLLLPTALLAPVLLVAAVAGLVAAAVVAGVVWLGPSAPARAALADVRRLLAAPRTPLVAVATSLGVTACHATVMAAAVQSASGGLPLSRLLPLVLVVQLGSAVPTSLAGWGPREGVAAWAFTMMGLDAQDGITASVIYGVVALVATTPGALVLAWGMRPHPSHPARERLGHG